MTRNRIETDDGQLDLFDEAKEYLEKHGYILIENH